MQAAVVEIEQFDRGHAPLVDRGRPQGIHEREQVLAAQPGMTRGHLLGHRADGGHARAVVLKPALQVGPIPFRTPGRAPGTQGSADLPNEPPDIDWPGRHGYLPFCATCNSRTAAASVYVSRFRTLTSMAEALSSNTYGARTYCHA